ncbi:MAG: hypothetical protein GX288_01940 [Clostridiales bacterium]|nr:hypothetical protein [Clostridiales bacterium]
MRTNKINDATKVLILVATVIVVCVLCAVGFKMVNEGKSSVNASTNNFNSMTGQYSEVDLAIYDGADVQGSEVVNLIKKATDNNDYLSIFVKTKANNAGVKYNYNFTPQKDNKAASITEYSKDAAPKLKESKTDKDYINPSAQFTGKVHKDANGIIICIEFTQL